MCTEPILYISCRNSIAATLQAVLARTYIATENANATKACRPPHVRCFYTDRAKEASARAVLHKIVSSVDLSTFILALRYSPMLILAFCMCLSIQGGTVA